MVEVKAPLHPKKTAGLRRGGVAWSSMLLLFRGACKGAFIDVPSHYVCFGDPPGAQVDKYRIASD